jgi:hypothetical protein
VIWWPLKVNRWAKLELATMCPVKTAANSITTPPTEGQPMFTLPGVALNIHRPIRMAMGAVMPMVKTPHGLLESALTTTMPSPASVTSRMKSTAIMLTTPAKGPISVMAMEGSERP